MRKTTLAVIAVLSLAGCASLPQVRQPTHDLPAAWPQDPVLTQAPAAAQWWKAYGDATLDALVDEALTHNADVRLAAARIEEARASLGMIRADQYPNAQISADASRSKMSERGVMPIPGSATNNSFGASLQAAYELDLWGRYRSASQAARAELLASEYAREVVRLSLVGDVVRVYFALRSLEAQAQLARDTLANREAAQTLQQKRFDGGVISELELRQAEAELAATQATLAVLTQQARQRENALAVLLGRSPKNILEGRIAAGQSIQGLALPPEVPAGLPSELLTRRPDLRQAEQQLAAANARIREARAALYPNLSLTAYLGSESKALADLFSGPATIWGLAAGLLQTVFDAGRNQAAIKGVAARQEQVLIGYEKAVQQAFREVLDALVAHRHSRELHAAETRRAETLQRALALAELRHKHGESAYLEVLDAQRGLYAAEQGRIQAREAQLAAIADLNTVLGGGWDEASVAKTGDTP